MSRTFPALLAALALMLLAGGCGKTHESIADDAISKMKEMQTALKDVKDESSAKSAAEKIKSIAADLKKLKEADDKLPKITADEKKKIDEKMKKASEENQKETEQAMTRIMADPKMAQPIMEAMQEFMKVMISAGGSPIGS
jgi:gas vesicle protein